MNSGFNQSLAIWVPSLCRFEVGDFHVRADGVSGRPQCLVAHTAVSAQCSESNTDSSQDGVFRNDHHTCMVRVCRALGLAN